MIDEMEILSELYKKTLLNTIKSEKNWIMLLKTVSRNYMLNFDDQILVYAQVPSSTALLEKRHWENIFHRTVKSDAKGIKVFSQEKQGIRYLFDVQDTEETSMSTAIPKWNFKEIYHNDISVFLSNKFGIESMNRKVDISYIRGLSDTLFDELEDKYKNNISYLYKGTDEELEEFSFVYKDFVKNSIAYIVYERIYEDSDSFFDIEDFSATSYFLQSEELIKCVGKSVSNISKVILEQIGTLTLKKNRDDEINERLRKAKEVSKKEPELREKKENMEDENSKFYKQEFSEPKLKGSASSILKAEEIKETINDVSVNDLEKSESNELQTSLEIETIESFYEQISFFEDDVDNFQKEKIAVLDADLKRGSGVQDGKFRIYKYFIDNIDKKDVKSNIEFLRKEYGIGGYSGPDTISQWHDAKGIAFDDREKEQEFSFKWNEISNRIKHLIKTEQYLTLKEKEKYEEWLKKFNEKERNIEIESEGLER